MNAVFSDFGPVTHIAEAQPIAPVALEQLADAWPKVSPWIAAALKHGQGDESLLDVLVAIARGFYGLWTDGASVVAVVRAVKEPRQSVLTVVYCGGELDAIHRSFEFAKTYCKQHKIDVLRVWGRPGWKRVLGLETIGEIMQVRI